MSNRNLWSEETEELVRTVIEDWGDSWHMPEVSQEVAILLALAKAGVLCEPECLCEHNRTTHRKKEPAEIASGEPSPYGECLGYVPIEGEWLPRRCRCPGYRKA